jgi:hypothetical protein
VIWQDQVQTDQWDLLQVVNQDQWTVDQVVIHYLVKLVQQVGHLQAICLQVIQWASQDQWTADQELLVICLLQWMEWMKCILTWMMLLLTGQQMEIQWDLLQKAICQWTEI